MSEHIIKAAGQLIAKVKTGLQHQIDALRSMIDEAVDTLSKSVNKERELRESELNNLKERVDDVAKNADQLIVGIRSDLPDSDQLHQFILEKIVEQFANIPEPVTIEPDPGLTADDVKELIDESLANLPAPEPGKSGEDGQDRPLVEPVVLKSGREYPKNTVGTYAGGTWIARKHAIGPPGDDPHAWSCVMDGIESFKVSQLGVRKYQFTLRQSTGEVLEQELHIPTVMHRGIFEEGETYLPGDMVTKGSSVFCAMAPTDHAPPGNGWQQVLRAPKGRKGDQGDAAEIPGDLMTALKALPDTLKRLQALETFFTDLQEGLIEGGSDD